MGETTMYNGVRTVADRASEQFSEAAHHMINKAEDLGKKAVDKMNETCGSAACGLESAASKIHRKAHRLPGGERVHNVAHSTADKMKATANYMKTHEMKDVVADVGQAVRRNPGQSLLAAVAVGFLAGRMFSRDRN
jgi:ElaB/YqjD/DUF883 family membrane-anchored ribosome-binding protein